MQAIEVSELSQGLFLTGVLGEGDVVPPSPPKSPVVKREVISAPSSPSHPPGSADSTSMLDFFDLLDIDVSKPLFRSEASGPQEDTKEDLSEFLIDFSSFQIFVSELCSEKLKSEVSDAYLKAEDLDAEDISNVSDISPLGLGSGSADVQQQWSADPQPTATEQPPLHPAPVSSPGVPPYYHSPAFNPYVPASVPIQNIEIKIPQFASEAPQPSPHLPHQYAANYYVVALPPPSNAAQLPFSGAQTGVYWQTMAPAPPSRNRRKPRVCSVCNKTCKNPYELKLHMNSHTGAKPYVCKVCGAAYSHYSSLSTHRRDKGHVKRALEN
ncbi:human immunodeficiency virus type I enhancer-binding protein 2 homolog [Penaeus monodon]|uniref:human immunodeficiency virus type I enhancer-binding protein 2 homolog n=1 Tax=Penaeus monodon TaxID=6687 RepID=UPI0018A73EC0|nr:human immunodeficiency virus type I enhancer-binding protein 2 homolog [Penaeus monodon]